MMDSVARTGMTVLRKLDASSFDRVYADLLRSFDPDRPREEWRRIFVPGWPNPEGYSGFGLFDGRRLVGFLGLIFSEMTVDGRPERLCNVTTWVSAEKYRGEAALLLFPVRDLKCTVTNLSANELAGRAFSSFGFSRLETHVRVFLPPTSFPRRSSPPADVILDSEVLERELEGVHQRVFEHHHAYASHLLLRADSGCCYVVYTKGRRRRLPTARIHYVSRREVFVRHIRRIQWSLLRRRGILLAECDERWLGGAQVSNSYRQPLSVPRFYRSESLSPSQISNLYSERVLLNLS